ncbi:MAG: hypothetical protein WC365_09900 [Candidatus Babeliales bacterium]|jgi:hypothetical protein
MKLIRRRELLEAVWKEQISITFNYGDFRGSEVQATVQANCRIGGFEIVDIIEKNGKPCIVLEKEVQCFPAGGQPKIYAVKTPDNNCLESNPELIP